MPKILIVDDERAIRKTLREILEYEKYTVDEAQDGMEGLIKVKKNHYDLVLLDVKMPKCDGFEVLERIKAMNSDVPIVMISGHANVDSAVSALKQGATDFISKPPDLNRMLVTIKNSLERGELIKENKTLQQRVNRSSSVPEIVGKSEAVKKIMDSIEKVAPTSARVLITGSNGTGKELVAKWIHQKSERVAGPMVEVNCAAIPSELIESELFGHVKGAFTSAVKDRAGKFEQANGGTLFLDEIGDMSLSAQAKVLRALQERVITRVGSDKTIPVDVRVIAATNKDLKVEIAHGKFREDLYHRLAVILLHVPSLCDRKDDIPLLAKHFVKQICQEEGISEKNLSKDALEALQDHSWTGNVRELRNVIERLIIMCSNTIKKDDVLENISPLGYSRSKFPELFDNVHSVNDFKAFMNRALEDYKSSVR